MSKYISPSGKGHIALWATAALAFMAFASAFEPVSAAEDEDTEPMFMFVHAADDLKVDGHAGTLRLVNVDQQVLYFTDRPVRMAGHIAMADYLEEWKSKAGADNFGEDPPNAVLSVYEPGNTDNTLVVVELLNPVVDGHDMVYSYKLINGTAPQEGGATALFIDWIGPGGGVGVGFHGVGVGARGPGVTGWGGVGGPASGIGVRPGLGAGRAGVGIR